MACTNTESFVQHGMRHVASKVNSGTIDLAGELLPDVTGLPGGWSQAPIEALECQSLENASKLIDGFAFSWQVLITFKRQSPVVPNQLICRQGKGTVRIRDT